MILTGFPGLIMNLSAIRRSILENRWGYSKLQQDCRLNDRQILSSDIERVVVCKYLSAHIDEN